MRLLVALLFLAMSSLSSEATTSLKVTWGASTDPAGSGVFGYNVYRCTGAACTPTAMIGSSSTNTYYDTSTAASTTYCYAVTAFDENNNESAKNTPQCKTSLAAATVNAATNSQADVQTAVNNANDGDIVSVPTGTVTWASSVTLSTAKGVTVKCATAGQCHVTSAGAAFTITSWAADVDFFYRISGFDFNSPANSGFIIWFCTAGGCSGNLTNIRIDHNSITCATGCVGIFFGENTSHNSFYGVVDNNTFSSPGSSALLNSIGLTHTSPQPAPLGTANNMFMEDNTVTITTITDLGEGCIDGWGDNDWAVRHNISTNCLWTSHGVTHGGGPQNGEFYNNLVQLNAGSSGSGDTDCFRCWHYQGSGEIVIFNNKFTAFSGKNTDVMGILHYCDYFSGMACIDGGLPVCDGTRGTQADGGTDGNRTPLTTYRGYPCWHQPGRSFEVTPAGGVLRPIYGWNNQWSDTLAQIQFSMEDNGGSPDYMPNHLVGDRDFYLPASGVQTAPTSPFNGTTGMGWGTKANRPTTCSTGATDAADAGSGGVGYFATDKGPMGTLYRCATTNNWVVHYQPFIYPHPLTALP